MRRPGPGKALSARDVRPGTGPEQGAEPLPYAATDPDATAGGDHGSRWSVVGPTKATPLPRSAQDGTVAARLWTEAERLTGVSVADSLR